MGDDPLELRLTDGGRAAAGFTDTAGDCAVRAIATALARPYSLVYDELRRRQRGYRLPVSEGVLHAVWIPYLRDLGWRQVPDTVTVLTGEQLPAGRLLVELTSHLTAVIDGVVYDTFDPHRGTARVLSVWTGPINTEALDGGDVPLF